MLNSLLLLLLLLLSLLVEKFAKLDLRGRAREKDNKAGSKQGSPEVAQT